jgi:hypothetical protein
MAIGITQSEQNTIRAQWLRASAVGGIVWTVAVALLWPGHDADGRTLAGIQLLLSPLALLPLAVALIAPDSPVRLWRVAGWVQLPAAALLIVAFALPAGETAAALAAPWLVLTGLLTVCGLARLRDLKQRTAVESAISAGLVYVAVGGVWTIVSRLGRGFLGFEEPIVLLTGAHFHYAGLLLPILTGLAARERHARTADVACIAVIVAVPLVAVGITLAAHGIRWPDLCATLLMSVVGVLVAFLQLSLAVRAGSALPRVLFAVSGVSLIVGMSLAAVYAIGNYTQLGWLSIPQMIHYHAPVNVFGFALPGLLAWLVGAKREA